MNTFEVNDEHLEHLFGLGYKKPRKNHKYIKKIETPKGVRYFYTEADLKAYYAGLRVKDKLGFDERERLKNAKNTYEKATEARKKAATKYSNSQFNERPFSLFNSDNLEKDKSDLEAARSVEKKAKRELEISENEYEKTLLGKFDNIVQAVKRFGKNKLSDIADVTVKKLSELYQGASNSFKIVASALNNYGVEEQPVRKSIIKRDERSIIERLSGGDRTAGSCVSLAMAYAGNKAGYDVLDFRGANSCAIFSDLSIVKDVAILSDVDSITIDYDGKK